MKEKLKNAIKNSAELASKNDLKADDALKYTQAALNAANALLTVTETEKK